MSIAKRAYAKVYESEKKGHHEMTYLLWDAIDTFTSGNVKSKEQENLLLQEIADRETWFIEQGVKETKKEFMIIGISTVMICGAIYGVNIIAKSLARKKQT